MYKHFVITRFNLKVGGHFNNDKNGIATHTKIWLDRRFYLFETFCLPSIENQTNLNFLWIVLFDVNTPLKFKNRIIELEKRFSNFKPLFLNHNEIITKALNEEIKKHTYSDTKYVITTRIDNDDAFHCRMIDEIQKRFHKQDDVFLNFEYGLQYDIVNNLLVKFNYKKNHFLTRIEKIEDHLSILSVLSVDHTQVDKVSKVDNILISKPMWIEIVHSSNVSNSTRLNYPVFNKNTFKQFGFDGVLNLKNSIEHRIKYLKKQTYLFLGSIMKGLGLYVFLKKNI